MRLSQEERVRRALAKPRPTYPGDLPVVHRKDEIAAAIRDHQVVVVCGETGSGKSTQLPKICLELGRGVDGMIGHTQPRRIAARTLAARIATELASEVGRAVGYKIRFTDHVSRDTYVKLMTDGILLAETQGDRLLEQYDTIILDEAHERGLNIDFLLGYLKQILPQRPDLKVIVTSATIDPHRFSRHFGGSTPVLEVSGRTYPVEVRYRPLATDDPDEQDRDLMQAILAAVDELAALGPGDTLVFLPGERDIREASEALRKHHPSHAEIVPLYARLSAAEQNRVFDPHGGRRIVLATNVAETSLTVPGIRYVIDTGLARVSRYDVRRKVQRLPIEKISQAAANQRAGRSGRTSPGVCIRLYSEEDFRARPEFTPPEILRTHLAPVILQMAALGLGDVEQFPFLEPPDTRTVRDGYNTLFELGAIDEEYKLTPLGRKLARLPVDPRIGRMILAGRDHACLAEILIIAAALSVQDPRQRPLDAKNKADEAHRPFQDEASDFVAYLNIWRTYEEQEGRLSRNKLRGFCEDNFLSFVRMREWQDIHGQLARVVGEMGFRMNAKPADYAGLHRALATGLLANVAMRLDERTYLGARNIKMNVFPGSGIAKKRPPWILAAELVETDRLYARTVAKIEPEWLEPLAAHLVGRSCFEPHWEKSQGRVMAYERVSLYGLPLVAKRKIDFGRIDAETAREIFIESALARGELRTPAPFLRHNLELVESIERLQERARQRDLLVDEKGVHGFYDRLVPTEVHSAVAFEGWRKTAERDDPRLLFMRREDILLRDPSEITDNAFPVTIDAGGVAMPLAYRFEPGHPEDGITATVPVAALHRIGSGRFDWLVSGLLEDKVAALLESLPKSLRKNFVPVPDTARECAAALAPNDEPLALALAAHLEKSRRIAVPVDAFRTDAVPEHLRMNFRVVDAMGKPLATSRDLASLQQRFSLRARETFAELPKSDLERAHLTTWDFADLPEQAEIRHGKFTLPGYPALVDERDHVALKVFDAPEPARAAHRAGLRRLYLLCLGDVVKHIRRSLPGIQAMSFQLTLLASGDLLRDDIMSAVIDRACIGDDPPARTKDEFERRAGAARGKLGILASELCDLLGRIVPVYHEVARALSTSAKVGWSEAQIEIEEHLGQLVYPGFVTKTPWPRLAHLARYLRAAQLRLERCRQTPAKDRERSTQITPLFRAYLLRAEQHEKRGIVDPELDRYRWLLEEWRVSLFAQELKTAEPVSSKRLAEQWQKVRA